jgi:predicted HicB family RNase H-like nuclease
MPRKKIVKRGRPEKKKGDKLDSRIPSSRCKPDERERYEKAARDADLPLTQWVRKTLNQAVEK